MMKIGAAGAFVALTTLSSSATAQDVNSECVLTDLDLPNYRRCHGPDDEWKRSCCDPDLKCIVKDANYGQCRTLDTPTPAGWDGTIADYGAGETTTVVETLMEEDDKLATEEEDEVATEVVTTEVVPTEVVTTEVVPEVGAVEVDTIPEQPVAGSEAQSGVSTPEAQTDDVTPVDTVVDVITESGDCAGSGFEDVCWGTSASQRKSCCDSDKMCMKKNAFYGQCRDANSAVPETWEGFIDTVTGDLLDAETILDAGNAPTVNTPVSTPAGTPVTTPTTVDAEPVVADRDIDVETPAETPAGATDVATAGTNPDAASSTDVYTAHAGVDYIPNGANAVGVVNILPASVGGMLVASQEACEMFCSATDGCNGASFYNEAGTVAQKNCWLKTLDDTCEVPSDAATDPNATLLLKVADTCVAVVAEGPALVPGPEAAAAPAPLDAAATPVAATDPVTATTVEAVDSTSNTPTFETPTTVPVSSPVTTASAASISILPGTVLAIAAAAAALF